MLKENEVLDQVEAYVAGQVPLRQLSAWLYEAAWEMAREDTPPRTQSFAYVVLGKLAEHSTAGFAEMHLREALGKLVRVRREELDRLARIIVRKASAQPEDEAQTLSNAQILEEQIPIAP